MSSRNSNKSALFVMFGIPTWALIDATWSSIAQISERVPESYNVSAYLILSLTFGNVVPLLLNNKLKTSSFDNLNGIIFAIMTIGFIGGILISFLWHTSVVINENRVSLPLCLIFMMIGACSSSSNVVYYTFASRYSRNETTSLSTGMALGSMIVGIIGLLHGLVLQDLGVSLTVYYLFATSLYIPAYIAFKRIIDSDSSFLPRTDTERDGMEEEGLKGLLDGKDKQSGVLIISSTTNSFGVGSNANKDGKNNNKSEQGYDSDEQSRLNTLFDEHYNVFRMQFFNALLGYGVIPALISILCSKFSHSRVILLLSTSILCVLDPFCRAITAYIPPRSKHQLYSLSLLLIFLAICQLSILLLPASSPLLRGYGGIFPLAVYVTFGVCFGFSNTSVYLYMKCTFPEDNAKDAYRWTGIATQSGALVGSLVTFILVVSGVLF